MKLAKIYTTKHLLVALFLVPSLAIAGEYSITDLGVQTSAVNVGALNNNGHAAGFARGAPFTGPFLYAGGNPTQLPSQNTLDEQPYQVNESDMIAGWASIQSGYSRGVIWKNGSITVIPTFGGLSSYAYGLNDAGIVVGRADVRESNQNMFRPFRWEQGNIVQLPRLNNGYNAAARAINSAGIIVGWSQNYIGDHKVVRWVNNAITDLGNPSGFDSAEAVDLNDSGQILVTNFLNGARNRSAVWSNGTFTELLGPLGTNFNAYRINNLGQVLGGFLDSQGGGDEAIYTPGQGYFLPESIFANNSEWMDFFDPADINDVGQILGLAIRRSDQQYRYVLLTPVPESATVWTLLGLMSLWAAKRRACRPR